MKKQKATTHGLSTSKTYVVWRAMKARVLNKSHKYYKYYGGRGIVICERWIGSFENFLQDMGERPQMLTLDRINNNSNYEPDNCKWSTRKEQANNRRDCHV